MFSTIFSFRNYFCLVLLISVISCSKVSPQGEIQVQEVKITDFEELDLKGNFKVFYVKSPKNLVSIETYPNIFQNLNVGNVGKTLIIKESKPTEKLDFCNITIYSNRPFSNIKLSDLSELNISSQLMVDELQIEMKDQAKFIGSVLSNKAKISMKDKTRLNLLGKTLEANINIQDSASIIAPYWYVSKLKIHSKNANYTEISVAEELEGVIENTSKFYYYGEPNKKLTQKDKALIEKKNLQ